jgi:hypothetical protein
VPGIEPVAWRTLSRGTLAFGARFGHIPTIVNERRHLLGFPATFIVHDTQEEVNHAFDIMEHRPVKGERARSRLQQNGVEIDG